MTDLLGLSTWLVKLRREGFQRRSSQFFQLKTSSGLTQLFKKALCLSPELPNWADGVAGGGDKTEDLKAYFSRDSASPSLGNVLLICETFCFGCHVIAGYHLPSVGRARIEDAL